MTPTEEFGPEAYGCKTEEDWEFVKRLIVIQQMEEDMKRWCRSSGEDVGRFIRTPGSDEYKIECPTCGTMWHGGSTVLPDHDKRY